MQAAAWLPGWQFYEILLTDSSLTQQKLQHDYILEVISVAVTTRAPTGDLLLTIPTNLELGAPQSQGAPQEAKG
jgi:hypothetical protein